MTKQKEKVLISKYFADYPHTTWESYFKAWLLQEHKLVSASSRRWKIIPV